MARFADRFSTLRKVSRHLEGTEAKAGVLSDIISAGVDIYTKNSDEIDKALISSLTRMKENTAARHTKPSLRRRKSQPNQNGGMQ